MMNLNFETILDFYTHKNRKILCQIKVTPPSTNLKYNNTCRCLSQKQWNTFDKELEKLITTNDDWNDAKCLKFNINPCIKVKVQKSKLSLKHFHKCLGAIEDCVKGSGEVAGNSIEDNFVLECLIDFQKEVSLSTSSLNSQEYEPQVNTSPDKLCSPLSYEPYKPSKKKYRADNIETIKTQGIDLLECNEDTYSPKPIFPIEGGEASLIKTIPKYTPAPIKHSHYSQDNKKKDVIEKIIVETGEEIKSLRSKLNKKSKKAECEYIPKSQEFAVVDVPVYIPTPIGETTQRKAFKSDYELKKHRKRSKTIDEFPGLLFHEKPILINEYVNKTDKQYHFENKKFKKRSRSIDEMPAGFAVHIEKLKYLPEVSKSKEKKTTLRQNIYKSTEKNTKLEIIPENTLTASTPCEVEMPIYIPTPIEENSLSQNVITTKYHLRKHKKRSNTVDEIPGQLPIENTKEKYKNNNEHKKGSGNHSLYSTNHLKKRSKSTDEIPGGLEENSENLLSKISPEENKGKLNIKLESPNKTTSSKLKESRILPIMKQKATKDKKLERNKIKLSPSAIDQVLTAPNKKFKKSLKIPEDDHKTSTSNLNISILSAIEATLDTTPPKVLKRERKQHDINSIDISKSLRRSERPPSKPVRFIEEQHDLLENHKSKKLKTSPKNKELFGTDDEDDTII